LTVLFVCFKKVAHLNRLCKVSFPNLKELFIDTTTTLDMGASAQKKRKLDSPNVTSLSLRGYPHEAVLAVVEASLRVMPKLNSVKVSFQRVTSEVKEEVAPVVTVLRARRQLVKRITDWHIASGRFLAAMCSDKNFRPTTIRHRGTTLLSTRAWRAIQQCTSVKLLQVLLCSSDLLGPMPVNVTELIVLLVDLNLDSLDEDLEKALSNLAGIRARLIIPKAPNPVDFRREHGVHSAADWGPEALAWIEAGGEIVTHGQKCGHGFVGNAARQFVESWINDALEDAVNNPSEDENGEEDDEELSDFDSEDGTDEEEDEDGDGGQQELGHE